MTITYKALDSQTGQVLRDATEGEIEIYCYLCSIRNDGAAKRIGGVSIDMFNDIEDNQSHLAIAWV